MAGEKLWKMFITSSIVDQLRGFCEAIAEEIIEEKRIGIAEGMQAAGYMYRPL